MPINLSQYYSFWELDPHKWYKCKTQVAKQMIAEGWVHKAKKFSEVQLKRARRLFNS